MNISPAAITLFLGLACANAAEALSPNLFVNPGFETGSLSPWTVEFNNPLVTTEEAHTGSYSVREYGNESIHQNFSPVPVSAIAELSVWVKHLNGPFNTYYLYYDDGTVAGQTIDAFGTNSNWQYFNLTSNLYPGKSLNGISMGGTSAAPAYFDDFLLTAVPEPSALALTILTASAIACWHRRH